MSHIKLKKENNDTNESELIKNLLSKKIPSLCWSCSGYLHDCQKILDKDKKEIDKYDFINEGLQIVNDDGKIDRFIISKCQNYINEHPDESEIKTQLQDEDQDGIYDSNSIIEELQITADDGNIEPKAEIKTQFQKVIRLNK